MHRLTIPDDVYATIVALATERGQTPEALATQLLQQHVEWEAACRRYDAMTASPEWQQMETEAEEQLAAGSGDYYASDDALKKAFEQHR